MPKIIFTVTNDLNYDQRMIRICSSLVKAGYSVVLVGRGRRGSHLIVPQPYGQIRLKLPFQKGKLFYLTFNVRLFVFLLFSRFDVVCSIDLDTLVPGYLVSKLKGKTCVYDAHEYFTEVPEVIRRPVIKRVWELIAGYFVPKVGYAYTVSGSLAGEFYRKYKKRFAVIRNLPLSKPWQEKLPFQEGQPFIIIYQGVLNEGRGLEQAIEAMASLSNAELWLAGEGDLSKKLRESVQKKGLFQKVKFLGKVSPDRLHQLTVQAHLGLNLLREDGLNYYYSLANKAFDYIQAGIPSLNMDFPEYRRLNEEFNVFYLLDNLDAPAIEHAVNILRSNRGLYNALASNCQLAKEKLVWENEEMKLIAFYKSLPY